MSGYGWVVPLPEIVGRVNWDADDLRYDATIVAEYLGYELSPLLQKELELK